MDKFGEIENNWNIQRATEYVEASSYFEAFYKYYLDKGDVDGFLSKTKLGEAGFTAQDVNGWLFGADIAGIEEALYNPLGLQRIVESIWYYSLTPETMTRLVSVDGRTVGVKWLNARIPYDNISTWKIIGLTTKIAFHEKPMPHSDFYTIEVWIENLKAEHVNTIASVSTSIGVDRRQREIPKGFRVKAECNSFGAVVGTMRTILQYIDGRISHDKLSETYDRNIITFTNELKITENAMNEWIMDNPGHIFPYALYWKSLVLTHGYAKQISVVPFKTMPDDSSEEEFTSPETTKQSDETHKEIAVDTRKQSPIENWGAL